MDNAIKRSSVSRREVVSDCDTHVMVVVRVWVLAVPGAVGQGAIVAMWEQATGAIEQWQAVGKFVVEVMASIVSIAPMDIPRDVAGARQRSVIMNVAVHVCWLVHVVSGVTLCSGEGDNKS